MSNFTHKHNSVVIVGASLAALRSAEALIRNGYQGRIDIVGKEPYKPYNRPPLSKEFMYDAQLTCEKLAFSDRNLNEQIIWHLNEEIVGADLAEQNIISNKGNIYFYDYLIIATGLTPRSVKITNGEGRVAHVVRSFDDCLKLRDELIKAKSVSIIGSGFIGCEIAAAAKTIGAEVTIITQEYSPFHRVLGEQFSNEIKNRLEAKGIVFRCNETYSQIKAQSSQIEITLTSGSKIESDLLIAAIGSLPNTDWLHGNDIDISNGVLCNQNLFSLRKNGMAWPNVFAVGDVARFEYALFAKEPRRIEHWNLAIETGKYVGLTIATIANQANTKKFNSNELETVKIHASKLESNQNKSTQNNCNETDVINMDVNLKIKLSDFLPIPSFWSKQFDVDILAFGIPAIADEVNLAQGNISEDFVFEYRLKGNLVGVAGIGHRAFINSYRTQFEYMRSEFLQSQDAQQNKVENVI